MATLTKDFGANRGDEMALLDDERQRTWAELDDRVNRLTNAMRDAGLGWGDTISVVAGNRCEWFEVAMACAHAGVTYVPVNWHWSPAELAYVLDDSGSSAVFVGHRFSEEVAAALDDEQTSGIRLAVAMGGTAGSRFDDYDDLLASASAGEPTDQALGGPMFYTSGTTGWPKGVRGALSGGGDEPIPPEVLQLISAGFSEFFPVPGVSVLCGPVYHSAQWAFSFLPMVGGSSVVMQHRYDSAGVLDLIDDHGGTNIHLVPTQMKRMLDLPAERRAAFEGSSLNLAIHGAAPCPPEVKRRMIDWWGPKITEYYGSTEGAVISVISAGEWLRKGGSVGKPPPMAEVIVVGEDGERLGPNEEGTLYFKNAMGNTFEYHNAPDKTEEVHLEPGVFTTGDVGYLDDEGYLWLSDRKIDMIISGGVNIYPAEIEMVIGGSDDVADVAVIGVPNEEFGEEVKAVVVLADGVADDDAIRSRITALCRDQLAGYKVPRSIDVTDELPRTGTGKIQKRLIRDAYWEGHDRRI